MKNIFTYILLTVYLLAVFKPALPIVEDALAHTFWEMHHLTTVHYENGKYHLHKDLKSDVTQNKNEPKRTNVINQNETLAYHVMQKIGAVKLSEIVISTLYFHFSTLLSKTFIKKTTPPPKVLISLVV